MDIKIFETLNESFVAHFARRFADLVNEQGGALLKEMNLVTPSTSVSTLLYLQKIKQCTITNVADALDVTHQMATQRINKLIDLGIVKQIPDTRDKRKRAIALSKLGQNEAIVLQAFTDEVARAFKKIDKELGCTLSKSILQAEKLLIKKPLSQRINRRKLPLLNKNQKKSS